MVKAAVIGASGYAGQELVRLLYHHPEAEIVYLGSRSLEGKPLSDSFRSMADSDRYRFRASNLRDAAEEADIIFLALPHGIAAGAVDKEILQKAKVIDLGADFRLRSLDAYRLWYHLDHPGGSVFDSAVYGLCELHRKAIAPARLVADPGCYTTCSILSLAPLLAEGEIDLSMPIVVDAKSGVSGAGRSPGEAFHFPECNESLKAYKVGTHRHTPEIEQELSLLAGTQVTVQFTPHLVPMNRGILVTAYCRPNGKAEALRIEELYRTFYADEPFVKILGKAEGLPETRWVRGSNRCDIGFYYDERTGLLMVIGVIDNLVKGAAGQAVQNMNIISSLPETMGLTNYAMFP